ncbi:AraC family transcriptional regulator [Amphibacillus marinus]|uniref:AraC family transcriptional regulator n=1 Tax=Amphibacillus marinus TaxID=872970 RepID=A0A1H8LRE1_9BACI|nr:AraC family transcriptional regulator [Amphibacillus marinus]SEO07660.1 AraC family transcriptional regulator [Amphibacillus marinus]
MDSLKQMNAAIDYIESHLTEEINIERVAQIAMTSSYHFKRMFSLLAGIALSDYIRRRRLTYAAFALMRGKRVIDVALEYGYHSPDAFARAFAKQHGINPSQVNGAGVSLTSFPKLTFQLIIRGGTEMKYKIEHHDAFTVVGYKKRVKLSIEGEQKEITDFISKMEANYVQLEQISDAEPRGILHINANYEENERGQGELDFYIAVASTRVDKPQFESLHISAHTWAIFSIEGDWDLIKASWENIYTEWLPTSGYVLAEAPELLISKDKVTEIWLSVIEA